MAKRLRQNEDLFNMIDDYDENILIYIKNKNFEIERTNLNGDTLLTYASKKKVFDVVKLLIEKGANIDHQNKDGDTALLLSIENSQDGDNDINGDNDMINFLLENNANIHIKNNNKYDALLMGIRTVNNTDVVKTIIKKGANINAQDEKGNTPLMLAINFESAYMVELLIEEGANVNLANNEGMTPLEIASTNSFLHPNIVRDLISAMSN